jgi:hypothetical protein
LDNLFILQALVSFHPFAYGLHLGLDAADFSKDSLSHHRTHLIVADMVLLLVKSLSDVDVADYTPAITLQTYFRRLSL